MSDAVEIRRKANPDDYIEIDWEGERKYRLKWQDRLLPGVIADSPEKGATEYNDYMDNIVEINRERSNNETLKDCYQWCMEGDLTSDRKTVINILLNAYHRCAMDGHFLGMGEDASRYVSAIFFHRSEVKATLSSDQIELLEKRLDKDD